LPRISVTVHVGTGVCAVANTATARPVAKTRADLDVIEENIVDTVLVPPEIATLRISFKGIARLPLRGYLAVNNL